VHNDRILKGILKYQPFGKDSMSIILERIMMVMMTIKRLTCLLTLGGAWYSTAQCPVPTGNQMLQIQPVDN
jgi:hypothetical protein